MSDHEIYEDFDAASYFEKSMNERVEAETTAVMRSDGGPIGAALPPEQIKAPITAAQAKIDAVASLTMKAYEKAATLQITKEESDRLQAEFPDEAFKPGAAGKESLIYVEHAHLRDRFIEVFGMGGWAMVPRNRWAEPFKTQKGVEGSRIYVEAMLVIRGCFVAEAVGEMEYYPSNGSQNYGDAVEGAETAAFRRCAKKFGVGLQAWKKDWCEGWWKRRNQRPQGVQVIKPAASPTTAPAAPQNAPSAVVRQFPTAETRNWMIKGLKAGPGEPARALVTEYFLKAGALLAPAEQLEDLPLRFVPNTPALLRAVGEAIAAFEQGEEAMLAFKPHDEPEPGGRAKTTQKPQENGSAPPDCQQASEWFMPVIVPVPRKGMRRDEYLKSPDTIGSLFEARHDDTADGQEARQRLWWFVNNYEPKGWTKRNGEQMPASDGDKQFRLALDAFQEWFEKTHPNEKL
jgi:hypothetical protein